MASLVRRAAGFKPSYLPSVSTSRAVSPALLRLSSFSNVRSSFAVSPAAAHSKRAYSSKMEQATRDREAVGPATWRAAILFILAGTGLYFYFESEKKKVQERRAAELKSSKSGRPKVGGPFSLTDQNGKTFTHEDLMGNWSLVYFGFTNCPDICPEELDKMGVVVDSIEKQYGANTVLPVFISVDPARDSIDQVKTYLTDFHPRMIGLTGGYDAVKSTCKAYRVYFSTPPDTKPGDDYLVDHSIYFYLMDPEGQFAGAFGKATTAVEVKKQYDEAVQEWMAEHPGWRPQSKKAQA